ncbi:hypothetical protein PROFUN_08159 [Planoprotostelium fungivorum]|uniref:Uncharacterized protein n=1 Tax=Planoprotostelium fungivorum TaxID=1890364 RepID=A0A2P6MQK6_9EUKA|nr:hypothetical protein PROFUN_08159 [Planoprotostelium fungivorum]
MRQVMAPRFIRSEGLSRDRQRVQCPTVPGLSLDLMTSSPFEVLEARSLTYVSINFEFQVIPHHGIWAWIFRHQDCAAQSSLERAEDLL